VAYIVIAVHPPYPVLVVVFAIAGFGNGLEDAAWNAWMGAMTNANEVLGFLHGVYGLGATIAPLIATSLITKADKPWWTWYYFMVRPSANPYTHSANDSPRLGLRQLRSLHPSGPSGVKLEKSFVLHTPEPQINQATE
jgi:fucose permease